MARTTIYRRTPFLLLLQMAILVVLAPSQATAQNRNTPATAPTTTLPTLEGSTLQKQPFQLAALKGKVVLVMFWATDCPVCRDQMPELRENVRGWADKPFELVLVSVDKRMQDVDSYNTILNASVPIKQRFTQLWAGEPSFKDNLGSAQVPRNQLPVTYLIDKTGKLVDHNSGRIPSAWWDTLADLL